MKSLQKSLGGLFTSAFLFLSSTGVLFAVEDVTKLPGDGDLVEWITTFVRFIIGLAGIIAALVLVINGFMYMTAAGDDGKIAKATKGITYALIGLIIAAISFLIVNFVIGNLA